VTVADGKVAEREIDKLNVEKAEMNARIQTLEAERAKQEAGKAMSEAERAQRTAAAEAERAAKAKAESDKLMKELANLKAQQTERGIVLTIGTSCLPPARRICRRTRTRAWPPLPNF